MQVIRLLVVEDEASELANWERTIALHNADDEKRDFEIITTYVDSLVEVRRRLFSQRFDAAVVDLRLKVQEEGGRHNDDGNEVVKLLASTEMAAVVIYTGQPQEADHYPFSPQIKIIEKGGGIGNVIDWLREQKTVIEHMQKTNETVQKDMATLFHTSLWPRWKYWLQGGSESALSSAVTRHLVSHLYADLLEASGGVVHPEEYYFVPPMNSKRVSTGDLIRHPDGKVEIVVTPRCDIEHADKSTTIQLAECEDKSADWARMENDLKDPDAKKVQKAKEAASRWRQHRLKSVLHFLPQMMSEDGAPAGPWFIRFDRIRSLDRDDRVLDELNKQRFASITSEFLPSVVERLGNFFSRIGTPDLE